MSTEIPTIYKLILRNGQIWERGQPWVTPPGSEGQVDLLVSSIFYFEEEPAQEAGTDEQGKQIPEVPAEPAHYLVIASGKFPMLLPCDPKDPEALRMKSPTEMVAPEQPGYAEAQPFAHPEDRRGRKLGFFSTQGLGVQTKILADDVFRPESYQTQASLQRMEEAEMKELLRAQMAADADQEAPPAPAPKTNGSASLPNLT